MQIFCLSSLVLFVQAAGPGLAIPVNATSILAWSSFCANAPTTIAGTSLHRRDLIPRIKPRTLPHLLPVLRADIHSKFWCAAGTKTYVTFTMIRTIPGSGVLELLNAAYVGITEHIRAAGDGLLPGPDGISMWLGPDGVELHAQNANNHQITWGVLGAAVMALGDYMHSYEEYGAVDFTIWDGFNQVGHGMLG